MREGWYATCQRFWHDMEQKEWSGELFSKCWQAMLLFFGLSLREGTKSRKVCFSGSLHDVEWLGMSASAYRSFLSFYKGLLTKTEVENTCACWLRRTCVLLMGYCYLRFYFGYNHDREHVYFWFNIGNKLCYFFSSSWTRISNTELVTRLNGFKQDEWQAQNWKSQHILSLSC